MKTYALRDRELRQILFCMESMASDYSDDTDDFSDYHSALWALQHPIHSSQDDEATSL